jgi:hypothetical protein
MLYDFVVVSRQTERHEICGTIVKNVIPTGLKPFGDFGLVRVVGHL